MSRRRGARSRASLGIDADTPAFILQAFGDHLNTLTNKEKHEINDGVLHVLSEIGFEQLPRFLECFIDNKTIIKKNNRYCFGIELIEQCLSSTNNQILLYRQNQEGYLSLSNGNVYCGTGGAAPLILDYKKKFLPY